MEGILNIFAFCLYFGMMFLCVALVISGILRWIKKSGTRYKRMDILSWIAFVILLLMFSRYYMGHLAGSNEDTNKDGVINVENLSEEGSRGSEASVMTDVFLKAAKTVVGSLIYVVILASVITMLFIVILCIYNGLKTIVHKKTVTGNSISDNFIENIKQPIVIVVITLGILSFFFIFPILVAEKQGGNLIDTWMDGIIKIDNLFDFKNVGGHKDNGQKDDILITYILLYIIIMGVGFAVVKLLYSVFERVLKNEEKTDLIDKYSSPIALLSVGVSFLYAFKVGKVPADTYGGTIWELLKSFVTVIFIIAIVILTLEIVRLLMDIRQKLIRQEAKYLFISLVGKAALLLLGALNSIYSAVNGMIGSLEDTGIDQTEMELRQKIVDKMKEQMEEEEDDDDEKYIRSFLGFDEKITKK